MADYSTRDQGQWVGCLHNWNLFKPREREKLNYVSIDHDWLNVWERSSSVAMLESKRSGRKLEINHGSMLAGWGKPWITSDKLWITVTDHLLVTSINEGVSVNPKSWAQLWFAWWKPTNSILPFKGAIKGEKKALRQISFKLWRSHSNLLFSGHPASDLSWWHICQYVTFLIDTSQALLCQWWLAILFVWSGGTLI